MTEERGALIRFSFALIATALAGCRVGGDITAMPSLVPTPAPLIESPIISAPVAQGSIYYSRSNSTQIMGMCMEGYRVLLSGDSTASQTCSSSSFSFPVSKSTDGIYSFQVTQIDPEGKASIPATLLWYIKTSISPLVITTLNSNPYSATFGSALSTLQLQGSCENNATLTLSGAPAGATVSGSTACQAGAFSINLQVPAIDYQALPLSLNQTDAAGNSTSVAFTWNRFLLATDQTGSSLNTVVASPLSFVVSGGSGHYLFNLASAGGSTGNFNSVNSTYTLTAGTIATNTSGNPDVLTIQDSWDGTQLQYTITLNAGLPDHMNFIDSNATDPATETPQNGVIGGLLGDGVITQTLGVQVTDSYGNGVAGVPVYFHPVSGSVLIQNSNALTPSSPLLYTDSNGMVHPKLQMGYSSVTHKIHVLALGGPLLDVNATGRSSLMFTENSLSSGSISTFGPSFGLNFGALKPFPGSFVAADFSGDGLPDLAFVDITANRIGVTVAKAGGYFGSATAINLTGCTTPSGITSGDFYNNGKAHLAVSCSGNNALVLLQGNGSGGFSQDTAHMISSVGVTPSALIASRLRGTSSPVDLAVLSQGDESVYLYYGNGDGSFTAGPMYALPTGSVPSAIIVADLQTTLGTSRDLVVADNGSDQVSILRNNGNGTFFYTQGAQDHYAGGAGPIAIVTGLFDADSYVDVAVLNQTDGTVGILLNNATGDASLGTAIPYPASDNTGNWPVSITAADLTNDGTTDLVVANQTEEDFVALNGFGDGTFNPMPGTYAGKSPAGIASYDWNGDGLGDILLITPDEGLGNPAAQVFAGDGSLHFGSLPAPAASPGPTVAGDFNGDGILDVGIVDWASNSVKVLQGLQKSPGSGSGMLQPLATPSAAPSPVFPARTTYTATISSSIAAVALRPSTANGAKLDVIVANPASNTAKIYLGRGDGSFQTGSAVSVSPGGSSPIAIVAQDFDEDGVSDLAVLNQLSANITVFRGNGAGGFTAPQTYSVGTMPTALVAADFTGDGRVSLASSNADGTVSVLLGNGNGTFQNQVAVSVYAAILDSSNAQPISLVAANFNEADPKQVDLASLNAGDMTISILHGTTDGTGGFTAATTDSYSISSAGSAAQLISGDFNGDGYLDLAFTDSLNGTIFVLKGKGGGKFNTTPIFYTSYPVLSGIAGLIGGDFDGNGLLDLFVLDLNGVSNTARIWLGH